MGGSYESRNFGGYDSGGSNSSFIARAAENVRDLLDNTKIEVIIGAIALTPIFSMMSFNSEKKTRGEIPIAFSELESQKNPGPLTRVYSIANDVPMKVFESNNIALAKDETHQTFAHELETRIDPAQKIHALISEYAKDMPADVQNALLSLDKLIQAERDLPPIMDALDRAWAEDHDDHYHTEIYYTTSTDSQGKTTTTMHTRQVYDYTDHTYDYYPQYAQRAADLLDAFVQKYPDLQIAEKLKAAEGVHGDNEEAILKSMEKRFKDKKPTAQEVLDLANTWLTGSNYMKYLPNIIKHSKDLTSQAPSMRASLATAHSDSYRTYSSHDSGPKELQLTKSIRGDGAEITRGAHKITDNIAALSSSVPGLVNKIQNYIDISLHGKAGNADDARDAVMDGARQIYTSNFENGFDVNPFKWWKVVLMGMLGAAVGAGAGFGVDQLREKMQVRRQSRRDERRDYQI